MRYVRLLFFSFISLGLIITVISLFFPSDIHISRAVQVSSSKENIAAFIAQPQNWKQWFPGADSAQQYLVAGEVKGIINQDKSRFVISRISDTSIAAEHTGAKGGKSEIGWNIITAGGDSSYTVQWYMDFHLRWYPWEKFSGLILDKVYGPDMEQGLSRLKQAVEN